MVKSASLFTKEIDDIKAACKHLAGQLSEKLPLKKNTVGIVQCHWEFVQEGLIEALHAELGFPLAGGTTTAQATGGAADTVMASVLVVTSDDVEFAVSHTWGMREDCFEAVAGSLKKTAGRALSLLPLRLIVAFPPIIESVPGDIYIDAIESVCGKVPVFGSLVIDDSLKTFENSASFCNGGVFKSEMSYVLFFGNLKPDFFVAKIRPARVSPIKGWAEITKASEGTVHEIEGLLASDYFESANLAFRKKLKEGTAFIPLLMALSDPESEIPFTRALIDITQYGSAVFRGRMFRGAKIALGSTERKDILDSAAELLSRVKSARGSEGDIGAALIFSCIVRQISAGPDPLKEIDLVRQVLGADFPFMVSYAGGEIAPVSVDSENQAENRFHNFALVACLF